jgi:hypothetical protein
MTLYTLTLLDASGIQDYIFSSNRLQENIGASEIVYRATTLWTFEELGKAGFKHNIIQKDNKFEWDYAPDFRIEKETDEKAVEFIYAAGGNAVLVFKDKTKAKEFTGLLTLRILQDSPGLTLLAQHLEFDWDTEPLSDQLDEKGEVIKTGKRNEVKKLMDVHKQSRKFSSTSLGFGVTAVCDSTGLPAVSTNEAYKALKSEPTFFISRETRAKLANRDHAKDRLEMLIGDTKGTKFPYDIDLLGRASGEESYVAVIHADGNRIGLHVGNATSNIKDNREYIKASRAFSQAIHQSSLNTIKRIVNSLLDAIRTEPNGDKYIKTVPLAKKSNVYYLPFRPLVFGGDDVTFLCNGQLGVELATKYLSIFAEEASITGIRGMFASAGVSIVKMHYPFARAYKLAEELTASAKTLNRDPKPDCSAIDWHFAQSGLSGSLEVIREKEYKVEAGKLHLRPLTMDKWRQMKSVLKIFKEDWGDKHNKVIGLREPLRNGSAAVEKYIQDFDLKELPEFGGLNVHHNGWDEKRCYYFDAIELLDHYVPLE